MNVFLSVLINMTYIFSGLWGMSRVVKIKKNYILLRVVSIILLIIIQSLLSCLQIPILNLLSSLSLIFASSLIFIEHEKLTFIIYDILIFISSFIADLLATLLISTISQRTILSVLQQRNIVTARYLLACIFTFMLCNLSFIIIRRRQATLIWYEAFFYILLAVGEAATVYYIAMNILDYSSGAFIIFFLISCFILDIYIVFVFYRISIVRDTEKENALLRQQSKIQLSVYQDLQNRYVRSIKIVHDVKKHVSALEGLIQNENIEAASKYKESLYEELDKFQSAFHHSNKLLTVIINNGLIKAEQNNITIDLNIDDFNFPLISDIDLTIMLSNILDNAIEAVSKLPENQRKILFIIKKKMNCFVIHVENKYKDVQKESDGKFTSTKKGHIGIGLKNIKAAVEKYDGIFDVTVKEDSFVTSITIPYKQ